MSSVPPFVFDIIRFFWYDIIISPCVQYFGYAPKRYKQKDVVCHAMCSISVVKERHFCNGFSPSHFHLCGQSSEEGGKSHFLILFWWLVGFLCKNVVRYKISVLLYEYMHLFVNFTACLPAHFSSSPLACFDGNNYSSRHVYCSCRRRRENEKRGGGRGEANCLFKKPLSAILYRTYLKQWSPQNHYRKIVDIMKSDLD